MNKYIIERVNEKLKLYAMTQRELAGIIGVSHQAISGFLSGDFASINLEIKLLEWVDTDDAR